MLEALESDLGAEGVEELLKGWAAVLVVVHLFFSLLALAAIHEADLKETSALMGYRIIFLALP